MFDVYVYNELGEFVDTIHDIAKDRYKALAMKLVAEDFSVKVVDQSDGVVVYTLDAVL